MSGGPLVKRWWHRPWASGSSCGLGRVPLSCSDLPNVCQAPSDGSGNIRLIIIRVYSSVRVATEFSRALEVALSLA